MMNKIVCVCLVTPFYVVDRKFIQWIYSAFYLTYLRHAGFHSRQSSSLSRSITIKCMSFLLISPPVFHLVSPLHAPLLFFSLTLIFLSFSLTLSLSLSHTLFLSPSFHFSPLLAVTSLSCSSFLFIFSSTFVDPATVDINTEGSKRVTAPKRLIVSIPKMDTRSTKYSLSSGFHIEYIFFLHQTDQTVIYSNYLYMYK